MRRTRGGHRRGGCQLYCIVRRGNDTALMWRDYSPDLGCVSEGACLLTMQQQCLSVQVVLQSERGSVPQVQVWILDQLCTEQAGKVKHLADLCAGLDRARTFNPHVVDGLTRADPQGEDQVTGDQHAWTHRQLYTCVTSWHIIHPYSLIIYLLLYCICTN